MFLKILNLQDSVGNTDYKGLDISKNVTGSQIYDFVNNIAYVEYNGTFTLNSDLVEITQDEYNNVKTALATQQGLTLEERLTAAEQTLNAILLGGI